jgi:hypothetical protein
MRSFCALNAPLVLFGALLACKQADQCSSALPGIPEVSVVVDPLGHDVVVSWRPVQGNPAGYEVEGAPDGSASSVFEPLHFGLLPPWVLQFNTFLNARELETGWVRVRARACAGGPPADDQWATVPIQRPLMVPTWFTASRDGANVHLSWMQQSQVSNASLLERRALDVAGQTLSDWTALPVAPGAVFYEDAPPFESADGATFQYRVRTRAGDVLSAAAVAEVAPAPLLAPGGLAATPAPGGAVLTWSNRSAAASELVVATGLIERAVLPASASRYEVTGLAAGRYMFQVFARRPVAVGDPITSPRAEVFTETTLPEGWAPLATSHVLLPAATSIARGEDGWYPQTDRSGAGGHSSSVVYLPATEGYDEHVLPGFWTLQPHGVLLDPQGRPHLVYAEGDPSTVEPLPIVHTWREGGQWQREVITSRTFSMTGYAASSGFRAAIDADGHLHVVWCAGADRAQGLEYATNAGGTWAVESMSAALPIGARISYGQLRVAVSGDGQVHVLLEAAGKLSLAIRDGIRWSVERVPVADHCGPNGTLGLARARDTTLVACSQDAGMLLVTTRTGPSEAGTWSTPRMLANRLAFGPFSVSVAASAAGRLAVAVAAAGAAGAEAPRVWVLEAGEWKGPWRGFEGPSGVEVGFRSDGKFWMLELPGRSHSYSDPLEDHVLYEEP